MKIVMLERDNLGQDIDVKRFSDFGELTVYTSTIPCQIAERVKDADIVIMNKMPMNRETMGEAAKLKLICETATGTDTIDLEYCSERGITVTNVKGYSTQSVIQHTFALAFYLLEKMRFYDDYVKSGQYESNPTFSYFGESFNELAGKTWGIIGLGEIGRGVAAVAKQFGCRVLYYSTSGVHNDSEYERVDFNTILKQSDIVSIHAPLNQNTRHLFTTEAFSRMKRSAYLINVGRGPIICEEDLRKALDNDMIMGAGLDVLSEEPIKKSNPLNGFSDSRRLLITPHIAWATTEARERLVKEVYSNIEDYLKMNQ